MELAVGGAATAPPTRSSKDFTDDYWIVLLPIVDIMPSTINTPLYQNALTRLGVEPKGASPVYQPELVAKAIVYAASHPVRKLAVGGSGLALMLAKRLSPRLTNEILLTRIGFESQLTGKPKSPDAHKRLTLLASISIVG